MKGGGAASIILREALFSWRLNLIEKGAIREMRGTRKRKFDMRTIILPVEREMSAKASAGPGSGQYTTVDPATLFFDQRRTFVWRSTPPPNTSARDDDGPQLGHSVWATSSAEHKLSIQMIEPSLVDGRVRAKFNVK